MLKNISFLWRVYAFALLNNLVLIYPVYSIMFQKNGLSVAQIGTALIWWSVSVILLQIPIGILSDRLSRRNMLIFGNLLVALAFFIFMVYPTFAGILCGFGFWGLKWAIDAACFQPMVYDYIKNKKKYLAIVGTCNSLSLIGLAISSLCSFFIFLGYDFLTWCTIGFTILGIIILLGMPRDICINRHRNTNQVRLSDIKTAARFVFVRPALLCIMGLVAILDGYGDIDEWLGLIALQLGYPEYAVGVLFFLAMICGAIGGVAVRFVRCVKGILLPTMIVGAGIMLCIASILFNIWSTCFLCVFWLLLSMCRNIAYADFQMNVSSGVRGRVTALLEILMNVATMGTYALMTVSGTLAGGYKYSLLVLGILLLITSGFFTYGRNVIELKSANKKSLTV